MLQNRVVFPAGGATGIGADAPEAETTDVALDPALKQSRGTVLNTAWNLPVSGAAELAYRQ